jgi:hypothetical protein
VRCADAGADHERQRVVVLEEELARVVEGHAERATLREDVARAGDDEVERLVPGRLLERPVATQERLRQTLGRVVCLPAV